MKWKTHRPGNLFLFIIEDPPQTQTLGGIILTEKLPQAAEVGFHTGTILKAGRDAHKLMGLEGDINKELIGLRVVFRKYLAELIRFSDKYEDRNVFILQAGDVTAITGERTRVDGI